MKDAKTMPTTKLLCPTCQTGADTVDDFPLACPYLSHYNGTNCSYYRKIASEGSKEVDCT